MRTANIRYIYRSYPQYNDFFGRQIGQFLKEGAAQVVDPCSMALWYACDRRRDFETNVSPRLAEVDLVIFNRYTLSSAVYQGARSEHPQRMQAWVFELEHQQLGLPRPDMYIVLDLDPEVALKRNLSKPNRDYISEGADRYEMDIGLQSAARRAYRRFVQDNQTAFLVEGSEFSGRPPESIADVIATRIRETLGVSV